MKGCSITVAKDNTHYVAYEDDNNFYIIGYCSSFNALESFYRYNSAYKNAKIGEIKGQVTIENLIFDYFSKMRGKI